MHQTKIDEKSFRYLYDLYFIDLCKSLNYYTSDVEVIEDIVQDVFVSLWENRSSVSISYVKTYLFTSVRNRMLNLIRDNMKFETLLEEHHAKLNSGDESDQSFNERLYALTKEAIDTLPEKCKEVFLLSKVQNNTYKQIASSKQISVKTVENQMGIAYKKIREYVYKNFVLSALFSSIL